LASIVVCAEPGGWQQASRFAEKVLGNADLKSLEDLRLRVPVQPLLVFLTDTDHHRLRSLPGTLQLGKLVGETRPNRTRQLREHFGLTQTELARAIGVSLRTVQNRERTGTAGSPRQLRDLDELATVLKESIKDSNIPASLRSEKHAFAEQLSIELLKEGKARDVIGEFRCLQAGE